MLEKDDHDLLIAVSTKLDMLISTQNQYLNQYSNLLERIVGLEIGRAQNVEKINTLKEDVDSLSKKSFIADAINGAAAALAGIIGYFFGPRP